jgi:chemotaxis protein histidine kinase CheA
MISVQSELMWHPDYPDRSSVESALEMFMGSIAGDDLALIQSTQEMVLAEVALMVGYADAVALKLAKKKAEEEAARQLAKKKAEEEAARQLAKKKAEEEAARQLAKKKAEEEAARQLAKKKAEEEAARQLAKKKAEEQAARLLAKKKAEEEAARQLAKKKVEEEDATSVVDKSVELEFWNSIKSSDDPEEYRVYLDEYPTGKFAKLAKLRIKKLDDIKTTVAKSSIPKLDYGDYYALVIGNNRYDHLSHLRTAVNDARSVANLLERDYGFNVTTLENANRSQIVKSISGLRSKVTSKDNVLIYYAGHGVLDKDADEGYWLPVDASQDNPINWVMTDQVVSQVRAMKAKHVMVVADSCFSGTITRGIKIEIKQPTLEWLETIVKKKSRTALTSGGLEPVMDSGSGNNSVFANSFLSILRDNDGVLDASQLFSQLRPKVMVNSDQTPEYGDIHRAGHDGGDFLFVRQ